MRTFMLLAALIMVAAGPEDAQETAVFRSSTQLVQVSVIVRDKNGPVRGLTKDAFELFDKGKLQNIALFQPPTPPAPIAAKAPALPANLYTNRLTPATAPRAATVVLLDLLNTQMSDQVYARQQVLKVLGSLDKRQKIAIYVLTSKLTVLQDFTDDPERLSQAAKKVQAQGTGTLDASQQVATLGGTADAETDQILNENLRQMRDFKTAQRVDTTLSSLEAIAAHMAGLSGARSLVWITAGFPLALNLTGDPGGPDKIPTGGGGMLSQNVPNAASAPANFTDPLQRAARVLNNTGMAIYPVDARGLVALPDSATAVSGGGSRASMMRSKAVSSRPPEQDAMQDLADRTGGKAFIGTNDLSGAIRQVLDDADATYVLGFYPDSAMLDRKFHDLKVKVNRGGLEVRNRKQYYAGEMDRPSEMQVQSTLRGAAASPVDASGIGIAAQIGPTGKPGSFLLRIAFELSDLSLDHKDDRWKGAADLVIVQQGNDGKILSIASETYTFDMKDDAYRARLKEGIVVDEEITPAAGLFQVRVMVADKSTGVIGSIRVPAPKIKM